MKNKVYHLKESKTFCMLGFIHTHTWPDGRVLPCCAGNRLAPDQLGNIYEKSWDEIWNGENYKKLRMDMIESRENPLCSYCYDTEKLRGHSMRTGMNDTYSKLYDQVMSQIKPDGEMITNKLYYWDFRFSNLCNQACITCGHDLSSSWYDLIEKMNNGHPPHKPKFLVSGDRSTVYNDIIENSIDVVDTIYFAGGEPMLVPEHWKILEMLIANGRAKDVALRYSTNLSTVQNKGRHVLDYWDHFREVSVVASIDEVGDRFNYIRWPAEWPRISKNVKTIVDAWNKRGPNQQTHSLSFSPVISIMNGHRLKDMMETWLNEGLIQNNVYSSRHFEMMLMDNILRGPAQFFLGNATNQHWDMVEAKLDEFEQWYNDNIIARKTTELLKQHTSHQIKIGVQSIKNIRQSNIDPNNSSEFKMNEWHDWVIKLDKVRRTDWLKTFPELDWMLKADWYIYGKK